jgi:hypothetical protein
MKMAKKKVVKYSYSQSCNSCGKVFEFQVAASVTQMMIEHYRTKHPDRMAKCFDDYGRTWNDQYDTCLKALHHTTKQRDQAIIDRDEIANQQRSLAAKLNAIVLVLRND